MPQDAEQRKRALLESAAQLAAALSARASSAAVERFLRRLYEHVPPQDLLGRAAADLAAAARSFWEFAAASRRAGEARLRVFEPTQAGHGWRADRTIVEIVNDDMPFLVDSVTAALAGMAIEVLLVVHPVLDLRRAADGRVAELPDGPVQAAVRPGWSRESLMHVEIARQPDAEQRAAIAARLHMVLDDVRNAVADWPKMRRTLLATLALLRETPPPVAADETDEVAAFLGWLDEGNFIFLGYREYEYRPRSPGEPVVRPGVGLGILRDDDYPVFDAIRHFAELPGEVQDYLLRPDLLTIAKSNRPATVHRAVRMDALGVKTFGAGGVTGERLFLGLFTSAARGSNPTQVPILRRKVGRVLARAGFAPESHDGKALRHVLDTFPRDELFAIGENELLETALGIINLQDRPRVALFLRRDPLERFVSALLYVPRDRYSSELRQRMAAIVAEACRGRVAGEEVLLDDRAQARIHLSLETRRGDLPPLDVAALERRLAEAAQAWPDRLREALAERGEAGAAELARRYGAAFPAGYREATPLCDIAADIALVEAVLGSAPLALRLHAGAEGAPAALGLKLVQAGRPAALSDVLPMLENLGLRVIGEVPHAVAPAGSRQTIWIQDFDLLRRGGDPAADVQPVPAGLRARFEEAVMRIWSGEMENDGFNRLILAAGLDWREVALLRLYGKVLRQADSTFSQAYMEEALATHPPIAARLVALFAARFDPAPAGRRDRAADALVQEIEDHLDAVADLGEDRILRGFLLLLRATLRTNFYQRLPSGTPKPCLAVKLASAEIDLLPLPRPLCEIFVSNPRVDAVHLRGGPIARGGIRWSDRREDFRTEILGLMKAQMVKNAVIVPVGSKGGFVVKRPPAEGTLQDEAAACYRIFMAGLLDLTDNIMAGRVVPPADTVRYDGDDPYLVVAADKGTASFSDIANAIAAEYGYWLGDAFASGGSTGYDHKGMGITARGAWELVKRHFRELGIDLAASEITIVGVGDMAGDVFGNGMLLSPRIRLVGAFNHRHLFIDPDPDAPASFEERRRLFALPGSSWADYDRRLLSPGGGIFERSQKSIALSPEARARFALSADRATPAELIRAMLRAPVDLLWFGGIGTFVKSAAEGHAEVGDKANDGLRVDGREIAARVVGEGANLAVTQRGRVEYALKGGRINTDAIDNSAGVDTSDHEVNLKILLDSVVAAGDLDRAGRNGWLARVGGEVAELVLRDNYLQGLALSLAEAQGVEALDQQTRLIRSLERRGALSRAVEFLPDDETLAARAAAHIGLTRPELAVLLAYAKTTLYAELVPAAVPDDPELVADLLLYFPAPLRRRFRPFIEAHRLRREIIATFVANSLVNRAGITFANAMMERTGRSAAAVAHAYAVIRETFALRPLWYSIEALDGIVAPAVQYEALLAVQRAAERACLWLLRSGLPLDLGERAAQFATGVAELRRRAQELLPASPAAALAGRVAGLVERGIAESLAADIASLEHGVAFLDILRLAGPRQAAPDAVARLYFALGERLGLAALGRAAGAMRPQTAWQTLAVQALLDDFEQLHRELTGQALAASSSAEAALAAWLEGRAAALAPVDAMLHDILAAPDRDLAMLMVAGRQLRALAAAE